MIYTLPPFGGKMVLIKAHTMFIKSCRTKCQEFGPGAVKGKEIYTSPCRIHLISWGFTDLQLELLSTVYLVLNSGKAWLGFH